MTELQTDNLTKRYGNFLAADKISMTIERGAVYGFVGENGAGKTTLIRMISGLVRPTSGTYSFPSGSKRIGTVGAIVENPAIHPYFTAEDNLRQAFILYGRRDYEAIPELLRKVGLDGQIGSKKKAKNFSLGMRQRLGIAVALSSEPEFLILDEPMNGLDPEGIVDIRNLILSLNKEQGLTFLISSHILAELARVATCYGFIHKGRLIQEISAAELSSKAQKRVVFTFRRTEGIGTALKEEGINSFKLLAEGGVEIDEPISIPRLISGLSAKGYETVNVSNISETIEDYYLSLIGGKKQ